MEEKTYNRARTVKLDKEEDLSLQQYCSRLGIEVSSFIRQAVNEKMNAGHISSVAGENIIEFNSKEDAFLWRIKLDSGEEKTVLEDVPAEFLRDLLDKISLKLRERDDLMGKKNRKSVPVPRGLVK